MNDLASYIGNADAFPILRKWHFFNHAGVCPIPKVCADAMRAYCEQSESAGYLAVNWYQQIEQLRLLSAELVNADREEIAFVKNTSEGLSIVASGIDWQWGDQIVTTAVEYPANVYPWMEVVRNHGCKLIQVPEETDEKGGRVVPTEKILEAASDPRCRIVSLSHVEYASGQRHDVSRIGQFCRDNKKLFCVDAIQTIGACPVDVKAMNIDYLSADGHKWMLGPEGAGIFFCRRELIERTRPLMVGWMNVVNATDYGNYNYTLRTDAQRFECGTYNVPGLLGLFASLQLIKSVGISNIFDRLKVLTDRLIDGLTSKGYPVISSRRFGQWSGIVSFTSPKQKPEEIWLKLRKEHQTEIAVREGRLRVSPHFYNTEAQIDRLIGLFP
jgi:selenocysteine lyase/cysteine desulfurase